MYLLAEWHMMSPPRELTSFRGPDPFLVFCKGALACFEFISDPAFATGTNTAAASGDCAITYVTGVNIASLSVNVNSTYILNDSHDM